MSYIEWFFVGAIILFFMMFIIFTWTDLIKDLIFYKDKKKNVKPLQGNKPSHKKD
jgi:hypothetical protein